MNLRARLANWLAPEARASDPSWAAVQSLSGSPSQIGPRLAENVAAVHACVGVISSTLASLPTYVHRTSAVARKEIADHPLMELVRYGPNRHQSWPDFIEALVSSTLLFGNGLAAVDRDPSGRLTALRFIPWPWVSVSLLRSGALAYDVTEMAGYLGQPGERYQLLEGECIHLRDRSDDGLLGRSRLSRCGDTVTAAATANQFAQSFLANGAKPSMVLSAAQSLSPAALERIRNDFSAIHAGAANVGKALILDGGLSASTLQISPEDSELLATRRFSVEEIARVFQVPPPLIQDLSHGTFTNSREAARWFAQFTLTPWANKLERAFSRVLFAPESQLELEMDLSGLLRGDPETRWQSHKIAVEAGILSRNEVREIEGYGPQAEYGQAL